MHFLDFNRKLQTIASLLIIAFGIFAMSGSLLAVECDEVFLDRFEDGNTPKYCDVSTPVITSADSLNCDLHSACSFTFTADGFPAPTFDLPGLPTDFSLDADTGLLEGAPETEGVFNLPVIERILNHLANKGLLGLWAESRAPPAKRIGLHS